MSVLKMIFGKHAPTHHAEQYWPTHDKTLNVVEARRGRGKSYGAVKLSVEWLRERMPSIRAGTAPHAKIYTNIRFNRRRIALLLCLYNICESHIEALDIVENRIVYCESWEDILIAYDSLILVDEANRNLNIYDSQKSVQVLMLVVHDWLQQTRKHQLTMYFLVQELDWLKPQVISLCDRLWRAKRVRIKGTQFVKAFPWYGGDPFSRGKDAGLSRGVDFKMRFQFDLRLARCYDTLQAVRTWPHDCRWNNFAELSDYMLAHGLKPVPVSERPDALAHDELLQLFEGLTPAPPAPRLPLATSAPPAGGAGGVGAGVTPDPFLAVTFFTGQALGPGPAGLPQFLPGLVPLDPVSRSEALTERYLSDVFDPSSIPVGFPRSRPGPADV